MRILLVHAAVTLMMFGVILVVQLVHYPLFRFVGSEAFQTYETEHVRRITWIVGPLMLVELATAVLLFWIRPRGVTILQVGLGGGLLVGVWCATAVLQVPLHRRLADGFSRVLQRQLVRSNWIRTALWGARAVVVVWMLRSALRS